MINYQQFKKIKELQLVGTSQREVAKRLSIGKELVRSWWCKTEQDFFRLEQSQEKYLDNYKAFILDLLKTTPQIRQTNIYYKLQENFKDFSVKQSTFYRYMKKLREEHGLEQFRKRLTGVRESLPPGEEAQVDFGQVKLKTMYGTNIKVYFFCMVLSYSNFRFVYFEPKPFTTETAIKAHNYAFKYFGGRTKKLMYDLDRVFVHSENFGNIILVRRFEEYIKQTGFQVVFCKARDPQTKGRVENLIGFVKQNFLHGRIYNGVDSLNADCLKWLDTHGNEAVMLKFRFSPRELFAEEQKRLIPVIFERREQKVFSISSRNTVVFKNREYELPLGTNLILDKVQVDEIDGEMQIFNSETAEPICCHKCSGEERISKLVQEERPLVSSESLKIYFADDKVFEQFMISLKEQSGRYFGKQCMAIRQAARYYGKDQMRQAFNHCPRVKICNFSEMMSYLIFKFGKDTASRFLSREKINRYSKRAKELEAEYGKQD